MKYLILCIVLFAFIVSCKQRMRFDKEKWSIQDDIDDAGPYRDAMLDDLIQNHKLKGLTYKGLTDLLGKPLIEDSGVFYDIIVHWDVIDPDYTKTIEFKFTKDSIVSDFKVEEF